MQPMAILGILLTLAAVFGYVNHRWLRLPPTIGLMLLSLALSCALIALKPVAPEVFREAERFLRDDVDFNVLLLDVMLAFFLFAGALHVNLDDLAANKWAIGTFATVGVVGSTFLVAAAALGISAALGLGIPWVYCLLFGALISPTDPIAVLAILKKAKAPGQLATKITGESLFNDGIGVVVFLAVREIIEGGDVTAAHVAWLFATEAVGGVLLGLVAGYIAFRLLRSIDNYQVEVMITLALVTGGYALALQLHISGPIAMVVSGLLIGNHGRRLAMSDRTREHLDRFWELIDELLNAILFVLIGLEVLVLTFNGRYLLAGALAVPAALLARLIAVGVPVRLLRTRQSFAAGAVRVLTWGGLRGGISIALALSIAEGPSRRPILTMTYVVVAFSILVQGLTVGKLVRTVGGTAMAAEH